MDSISRSMAQFVRSLTYDRIPQQARHEAKRFLLDSVGCALAALDHDDMRQAYDYVRALAGREQATVIGHGTRTNLGDAALMNALLIRAMDYNDIYWKQDPSHPSDIIPAALAPAEYEGANRQGSPRRHRHRLRVRDAALPCRDSRRARGRMAPRQL